MGQKPPRMNKKDLERLKKRTEKLRHMREEAKRLESAPLRRRPLKDGRNESPISLHFTVERPHSKHRQDASNEASSRFEAAYRLFRRRHPNSVPITGRQSPPKDYSPIEYAEWAIWKARERWSDATWDNWFLGFYEKLVKSESLKEVCQDQCKSTDAAYALLGLLLWDADRFQLGKATGEHVYTLGERNFREEQAREALWQAADPDTKKLVKIQDLVRALTFDYALEVNEDPTPVTQHKRHHRKTLAEIIDGFLKALAEAPDLKKQISPDTPQRRGRPELGLTSRDMFCALVEHFVEEAFGGVDHIWQTIFIINDFAPGLLKDSASDEAHEANAFVQRLKAFQKREGAIEEFNFLVAIYKTHRSFPSIMQTFQPW